MLYRIDTASGPVSDFIGVYLFRHMRTSRWTAQDAANDRRETATITRIGKSGQTSIAATINPQ